MVNTEGTETAVGDLTLCDTVERLQRRVVALEVDIVAGLGTVAEREPGADGCVVISTEEHAIIRALVRRVRSG